MSGLFRKSMVALSGLLIAASAAARQPSAHSLPPPVSVHVQSHMPAQPRARTATPESTTRGNAPNTARRSASCRLQIVPAASASSVM